MGAEIEPVIPVQGILSTMKLIYSHGGVTFLFHIAKSWRPFKFSQRELGNIGGPVQRRGFGR